MFDFSALGEKIAKQWAVDDTKQLGLEACTQGIVLQAEIERFRQELDNYRWIPVSEALPGGGGLVESGGNIECIDKDGELWFMFWVDFLTKPEEFTHWRITPNPKPGNGKEPTT